MVVVCRRLTLSRLIVGIIISCAVTLLLNFRPSTDSTKRHSRRTLRWPPVQTVYRWIQDYNESNHQILPNSTRLRAMTWPQLAHTYHSYIENIQVVCHTMVRLGNLKDGGWETCTDTAYSPRKPCIIYSFGINNDFSFDDDASKFYGCHIHSFDPSTTLRDHVRSNNVTFHATGVADFDGIWKTWRMRTLQTIADELGHEMSAVSLIKLDVEEWEWKVLPQALSSHALDEVSQLLLELHVTIKPQPRRERYLHALLTLARLYRSGFRIFYTRRNLHCSFRQIFDGSQKAGCHEVHMVKIHSRPTRDVDN